MEFPIPGAPGGINRLGNWFRIGICAVPSCHGLPLTVKSLKPKDYSETPQTLGEHLKKRRRELGLLQREAGERLGVTNETVANWE